MEHAQPEAPPRRGLTLTQQIFVGLAVGIAVGWFVSEYHPAAAPYFRPFSLLFLRLIKMVIAPLIFATLVAGIAGAGHVKVVGRMGLRAILYFEVVTTLALVIGLVAVNVMRPGVGVNLPMGQQSGITATPQTWDQILLHVVPESVIRSMAEGDVLQIVVFSIIFAIALGMIGEKGRPIIVWCEALAETMFKFTNIVMHYAPIGVGAAIAYTVGHGGVRVLWNLAWLVATLYIALAVFILVVLLPIALIVGVPIRKFIKAVKEPAIIAFSTTSSEAALPRAMEVIERLGVPRRIVAFVLPLGYSFNLDGTTLYLSLASIFVAQAAGVHLSPGHQITMLLTLMLTSKGVAGVPRASLVILAATLASYGLPLEGVTLILGVDELMDMARTMVNVIGNCLATVVVAKWEGEFVEASDQDLDIAAAREKSDRRMGYLLSTQQRHRFQEWFFEGQSESDEPDASEAHKSEWWKVMCLTGVDYFSTLGYQPGIAFLAAGALSPIATLVLVLLTLFGALPMYCRVAELSPNGQGSISVLEEVLPRWRGKALILCLLGFAATGFIITITLSAADATAHLIENPFVPKWAKHPIGMTLVLLAALGAVFLKGFREAVSLALPIVGIYIALNVVVLSWGVHHLWLRPWAFSGWYNTATTDFGHPAMMLLGAILLFPRLALGLSGFETGVAIMPLVKGDPTDTRRSPAGRIRNTKKLLTAAALLMSVLLVASSIVTTLLIPPAEFVEGGEAYGRALAYVAHEHLGEAFGTAYDVSTVAILWFAGASAMVGLLNLVPRYLPRYGMAPEWAKAHRPLVIIFTLVACLVTVLFKADVNSQGGAYATGVLVLMGSAALAVTLAGWRANRPWFGFMLLALVFLYTTIVNIVERPDGVKIASWFIVTIIATSMISRVMRSTELRIRAVEPDEAALQFIRQAASTPVRIIANRPDSGLPEYEHKLREASESHHLPGERVLFLEVRPGDVSEFSGVLRIRGVDVGGHHVLRCVSAAIPNAIAALLLYIRDETGRVPHAYFGWTEGNPLAYLLKFLAFGEGDTAPVTREVLRQTEADPLRRPRIHVG